MHILIETRLIGWFMKGAKGLNEGIGVFVDAM